MQLCAASSPGLEEKTVGGTRQIVLKASSVRAECPDGSWSHLPIGGPCVAAEGRQNPPARRADTGRLPAVIRCLCIVVCASRKCPCERSGQVHRPVEKAP